MLYIIERQCVASIDVGKKFFVSLLVARCVREVEAHKSDEGENVANRQIWHVSKLRHAGVDGRNVVGAGGRGVIFEAETRLEATGKELVRNRSTCQWVQDKNFCPGGCATIERTGAHAHKNLVQGLKILHLLLKSFQNQFWRTASEALL